jgi:DNA-binding NarL/FixJ family response regulator
VVAPRPTRHAARKAIEAGVAGLVGEADAERSLCLAVRSVAAGQLSIPIALADGLGKPVLSNRERQVLGMVVMGFTNADIARRLFLAESTVKSHLSSIFGKLGVKSRKEAAALVLDPDGGLGTGILAISDEGAAASRERAHEGHA